VLDEAHNFAPQGKVPDPDTGKMLHAANTLASQGRSRGIRLTMITQRPQKLHKDSLTSADTLIAMRVLAPHDRGASRTGSTAAATRRGQGSARLAREPAARRGLGLVSRGRLPAPADEVPADQDVRLVGHADRMARRSPAPKGAAEIDLTEIRAALADAVKEAEANDPKLLRAAQPGGDFRGLLGHQPPRR
jgi:hypothetical protein